METTATAKKISIDSPNKQVPGGFGRRFVAVLIDGIIISIASFPLAFIVSLVSVLILGKNSSLATLIIYSFQLMAIYWYYGFFYSNKGATPGKMLMKLRVINSETGKNISYFRAFFRETLGRIVSTIPLLMGYIIVLFRKDKKGFHDMLCKTQVLHQIED